MEEISLEMEEMSRKRRFRIWLRFTLLAVGIHLAILFIVFAATGDLNPTTSEIAWLTSSSKYEDITTPLPFTMSRWLDIFVWPIWLGILVPFFTSKRISDDNKTGLTLALVFGLAVALIIGLIVGLSNTLIASMIIILGASLTAGLAVGLTIGLRTSLVSIPGIGLGTGLVIGLAFGLSTGLITSLIVSLAFGLGNSLGELVRRLCHKSFWSAFQRRLTNIGRWLIAHDTNANPA